MQQNACWHLISHYVLVIIGPIPLRGSHNYHHRTTNNHRATVLIASTFGSESLKAHRSGPQETASSSVEGVITVCLNLINNCYSDFIRNHGESWEVKFEVNIAYKIVVSETKARTKMCCFKTFLLLKWTSSVSKQQKWKLRRT